MNILYEIVCKNVHPFMKKSIWILLANFRWSNLPHQTVEKLQKKNHGVLRGPQLDKQR